MNDNDSNGGGDAFLPVNNSGDGSHGRSSRRTRRSNTNVFLVSNSRSRSRPLLSSNSSTPPSFTSNHYQHPQQQQYQYRTRSIDPPIPRSAAATATTTTTSATQQKYNRIISSRRSSSSLLYKINESDYGSNYNSDRGEIGNVNSKSTTNHSNSSSKNNNKGYYYDDRFGCRLSSSPSSSLSCNNNNNTNIYYDGSQPSLLSESDNDDTEHTIADGSLSSASSYFSSSSSSSFPGFTSSSSEGEEYSYDNDNDSSTNSSCSCSFGEQEDDEDNDEGTSQNCWRWSSSSSTGTSTNHNTRGCSPRRYSEPIFRQQSYHHHHHLRRRQQNKDHRQQQHHDDKEFRHHNRSSSCFPSSVSSPSPTFSYALAYPFVSSAASASDNTYSARSTSTSNKRNSSANINIIGEVGRQDTCPRRVSTRAAAVTGTGKSPTRFNPDDFPRRITREMMMMMKQKEKSSFKVNKRIATTSDCNQSLATRACTTTQNFMNDNNTTTTASSSSSPSPSPSSSSNNSNNLNNTAFLFYFEYYSSVTFQLVVLFCVIGLLIWSRSQAVFTTDTLLKLSEDESIALLRLHKIENQSLHLHDLIRKKYHQQQQQQQQQQNYRDDDDNNDNENENDDNSVMMFDKQYNQLRAMTSELEQHVTITNLQKSIQRTASEEIVASYGEGPIKVVLELDFHNTNLNDVNSKEEDEEENQEQYQRQRRRRTVLVNTNQSTKIIIVLWPNTPHAAWTWLKQIQKKVWDGSERIQLDPLSTMLQFQPNRIVKQSSSSQPSNIEHLEFIEQHPMDTNKNDRKYSSSDGINPGVIHGAWTVGLRETVVIEAATDKDKVLSKRKSRTRGRNTSPSNNNNNNNDNPNNDGLEMFINLSDNQQLYQHEATCVGKIIDGFDTLQRVFKATASLQTNEERSQKEGDDEGNGVAPRIITNVSVKALTASHMTHQELNQLFI